MSEAFVELFATWFEVALMVVQPIVVDPVRSSR